MCSRRPRRTFGGMKRFLALAFALSCAHQAQLVPAPDAPRASDGSVSASAAGVEVRVDSRRWSGSPRDLPNLVTPLWVSVTNESSSPVRIRYRDFQLLGLSGLETSAIPPLKLQRPGTEVVAMAPAFTSRGFLLYPPYRAFYPGLPVWGGPWDFDPWFYDHSYSTWQPSLPTKDMLEKALPEGVLQPGGSAAGFLYFHHLRDNGPVTFEVQLIDGDSRALLGTVQIPMVVQ
jgi:hypothetical protein